MCSNMIGRGGRSQQAPSANSDGHSQTASRVGTLGPENEENRDIYRRLSGSFQARKQRTSRVRVSNTAGTESLVPLQCPTLDTSFPKPCRPCTQGPSQRTTKGFVVLLLGTLTPRTSLPSITYLHNCEQRSSFGYPYTHYHSFQVCGTVHHQ